MLLPNKVYDVLKPLATTVLPGVAALYLALAGIWDLPDAEQVSGTVAAVNVFLGILLSLSSSSHKALQNSDAKYDGEFLVEDTDKGQNLRLLSVDYDALNTKSELTFKLNAPPPPPAQ